MKIGQRLIHPEKGLVIVNGKDYEPIGNKVVWIAKDEKGRPHKLDGTEKPEEQVRCLQELGAGVI